MNKDIIESLAKGLHFSLSDKEIEDILVDFKWLEIIQEEFKSVSTEEIEPMFTCFEMSDHVLTPNSDTDVLACEEVLQNARHTEEKSIVVPKVVPSS